MKCRITVLAVAMLIGGLTQVVSEADDVADAHLLTLSDVEQMLTSLSNWGRWGDDDELGALNLITPTKRVQAAALVRDGISVSLAHESVKEPIDQSEPFKHTVTVNPSTDPAGSAGDVYSVQYHGYTQTHIDGLAHLFYKNKMYNGFSSKRITPQGCPELGVENFRNGIFTRAILMDIPELLGVEFLEGRHAIYPEHLTEWEKQAGVQVSAGDAVLIRTGRWTRRKVEGPWEIRAGSAGLHASCLPWLRERDVAVVGSDLCLDVVPSGVDGFRMPVHWVVVTAMGVPILDNCDFEEVSQQCRQRRRWEFLLTVAPLVVTGGTGSPINPIATF